MTGPGGTWSSGCEVRLPKVLRFVLYLPALFFLRIRPALDPVFELSSARLLGQLDTKVTIDIAAHSHFLAVLRTAAERMLELKYPPAVLIEVEFARPVSAITVCLGVVVGRVGDWAPAQYQAGDAVSHEGSSYIAREAFESTDILAEVELDKWFVMAVGGTGGGGGGGTGVSSRNYQTFIGGPVPAEDGSKMVWAVSIEEPCEITREALQNLDLVAAGEVAERVRVAVTAAFEQVDTGLADRLTALEELVAGPTTPATDDKKGAGKA